MAIKAHAVDYAVDGKTFEGHVAWDDAKPGPRPGIVLFPDWRGVDGFDHKRCAMLAELGYAAFAVDVYGKGVRPTAPADCEAESKKVKQDRLKLRALAAAGLAQLRQNAPVDAGKMAAIGYCLGGLVSLELARSGADIKGAVSFHGNLQTPDPADAKNIKAKILVLHGAVDPIVPPAEVDAFLKEMNDAKANYEFVAYGGVVHSFTNWNIPEGTPGASSYHKQTDTRSWIAMQNFFSEIFA